MIQRYFTNEEWFLTVPLKELPEIQDSGEVGSVQVESYASCSTLDLEAEIVSLLGIWASRKIGTGVDWKGPRTHPVES